MLVGIYFSNTMIHQKSFIRKAYYLLASKNYSSNTSLAQKFVAKPVQPKKNTFSNKSPYFSDSKVIRVVGGRGGDGCISFLHLWCNEFAGPDGGDGGNGGHIIFQPSSTVFNLNQLVSFIKAEDGAKGNPKDCSGKNAANTIISVPIGTIIRDLNGKIVSDLKSINNLFIGARGGSGGKGNRFFVNSKQNTPKFCEYGSVGESITYLLELRCLADIALIGCPNAGKSTLLRSITRASPKIAPYEFTTLRPHIGIVTYDDHQNIAVADLPGLIAGSSKNKGLGIRILKHVERCSLLLFVIDVTLKDPWNQYSMLLEEISMYNVNLLKKPKIILANKIDLVGTSVVLELEKRISMPVIPISAKSGLNITNLLNEIRKNQLKQV